MTAINANRLLIVVAFILFVLAAVGVGLGSIGLLPLGLAFFAASFLL